MDQAATAVVLMEAVETRLGAVRGAHPTGSAEGSCRSYGQESSRPVVPRRHTRTGVCPAQCLLHLARDSPTVQNSIAQPAEPPYADPHVRWCDRENGQPLTYVDCTKAWALSKEIKVCSGHNIPRMRSNPMGAFLESVMIKRRTPKRRFLRLRDRLQARARRHLQSIARCTTKNGEEDSAIRERRFPGENSLAGSAPSARPER